MPNRLESMTSRWLRVSFLKRIALAVSLSAGALAILLGVPKISYALIDRLQVYPAIRPSDLDAMAGANGAIVILSAGRRRYAPEFGGEAVDALSLERVRYGAYLARASGLPVLVSGGNAVDGRPSLASLLADALQRDYGIKARWLEDQSRNTAENAIFSSNLLRRAGIHRIVLVTHAWHMKRAYDAFVANGMEVTPAPTAFYRSMGDGFWGQLIPSVAAFRMSGYALHESVGSMWYALRYGY